MNRASHLTLRLATPDQSTLEPTPHAKPPPNRPPTKAQVASRSLQRLQTVARELYDFELYRESTDLFRYLTMIEPSNPTHWYWLGRSLISVGDPFGAAQVYELGGRLSHITHFAELAADAWLRAGYPDFAEAARGLKGLST
jgi:hypothetical protein